MTADPSQLRIVQIDLGCGHVVERLATESSRGLRGSLLRCPWCDDMQLVIDVAGAGVDARGTDTPEAARR